MLKVMSWLQILAVALICSGTAAAQTPDAPHPSRNPVLSMHNIHIDKVKKEIRVHARLAITEGILEYLLVGEHGKTYESVFKVAGNKPSELNFALLLIGAEPLNFDTLNNLLKKPGGADELLSHYRSSLVEITIFKADRQVTFDRLLKKREPVAGPLRWVFTGGTFLEDNRYAGDFELSYIGVWPDPSAVINLFSNLKNPYRGDFGYEMNRTGGFQADEEFVLVIRRVSQ